MRVQRVKRSKVTEWPAYLLVGLPPELTAKVNAEAFMEDMSINETIRAALCTHYRLRCRRPPGSIYTDPLNEKITLRFPPLLWEKMKQDVDGMKRGAFKALIVRVMEEHYATKETPEDD